jgi:hypothetical protein
MESNKIVEFQDNSKISQQHSKQENIDKWLVATASIMGKDLTPIEFQIWQAILEHYPDDKVERAFRRWIATEKFFPKPVEITDTIQEFIKKEKPFISGADKVRQELAEYNQKRELRDAKEAKERTSAAE